MDAVCGGRDVDERVLLWAVTGTSQAHGCRDGTGERREPVAGLLVLESDLESFFLARAPPPAILTFLVLRSHLMSLTGGSPATGHRLLRSRIRPASRPHAPYLAPPSGPFFSVPPGRILLDPRNSATCQLWKPLRPGPCASPGDPREPTARRAEQEVDLLTFAFTGLRPDAGRARASVTPHLSSGALLSSLSKRRVAAGFSR